MRANREVVRRPSTLVPVLILGLAACGTEQVIVHEIVIPPDTSVNVTVTPNAVSLNCGQTVKLVATVTASASVSHAVLWSTSKSTVVGVDSTGLVHASGVGTAMITATSIADPSKMGTSALTVADITLPAITLSQINEAATGQAANLNAITDSIDVTYNIRNGGCFGGALPWVSVTARITNGQDSLTATVPVPAARSTGSTPVTIRLNTAAKKANGAAVLPNGTYTLTGYLLGSDGTKAVSTNSVQVTVVN